MLEGLGVSFASRGSSRGSIRVRARTREQGRRSAVYRADEEEEEKKSGHGARPIAMSRRCEGSPAQLLGRRGGHSCCRLSTPPVTFCRGEPRR
ncbi:hypothetical protein MRX96_039021 [Rhipicephalus microplus]